MFDAANPTPWVVGMLVVTLAYFLRDSHTHIKAKIEQAATQKALEEAKESWRQDLRELTERHQRETTRMEAQYELKFAAVVSQFQGRMDSIEKNLNDKMDMILHIIERRNS